MNSICFSFVGVCGQTFNPFPQNTVTKIGETPKLECTIEGAIDPTSWFNPFDQLSVDDLVFSSQQSDYDIEGKYNLRVLDANLHDVGTYKCAVAGSSDVNYYTAELIVLGIIIQHHA